MERVSALTAAQMPPLTERFRIGLMVKYWKKTPSDHAAMKSQKEAVEKNGFTHKDATVVVRGMLSGTAQAPVLEVSGTKDRYGLVPLGAGTDVSKLLGKTVVVEAVLPQSGKGKVGETLRYKSVVEGQ